MSRPDDDAPAASLDAYASVESLAKFPDENPNPLMRIQRGGRLVYANAACEHILAHWNMVVGETVPKSIQADCDTADENNTRPILTVDTGERDYRLQLVNIEGQPYVNLYGRDVTEQRRAEERVLDVARFPDENPNPVMRVNPDGTLTYANEPSRACLETWGIKRGDILPSSLVERIAESMRSGLDFDYELETHTGRIYELGFAPIIGRGYMNVYGRNITKRRIAENEVIAARDAALAANKAKSGFLANMSHELRTPMNAIIGYSEMLLEDAAEMTPEEMVPDLRKIYRAGEHLLELINDILDLSKIEAGRMQIYLEDVPLTSLLAQVIETATPLCERNNNEVKVELPGNLPVIHTDVTKAKQMLLNLLSNAAKFTTDGTITVSAKTEDDQLELAVMDTGVGMSREQLSRVFTAFAQADSSTTKQYGGTGLGLTITRRFAEMLGGSLEVESELGTGSTFRLLLPLRSSASPASSRPSASRPPSHHSSDAAAGASNGTVLVIDDDEAILDVVRATLTKEGFDVVCARNGIDGLRLAHKLKPVAITLDIVMQGMDGWHVLTALKASAEVRDIPVILMTTTPDKNLGMALGAAEFVTKPVDRPRLVQLIRSYCAGDPNPELLVVEDDAELRALLSRTIDKQGWRSRTAENGREALMALEEGLPRLILLDLMMPIMDGFEFLARIRSDVRFRDIPVIVITAKELDQNDRRRLQGNVSTVLQKGAYKRDELMQEVRRLISQSTGRVSTSPPSEG